MLSENVFFSGSNCSQRALLHENIEVDAVCPSYVFILLSFLLLTKIFFTEIKKAWSITSLTNCSSFDPSRVRYPTTNSSKYHECLERYEDRTGNSAFYTYFWMFFCLRKASEYLKQSNNPYIKHFASGSHGKLEPQSDCWYMYTWYSNNLLL